MASIIIQNSMGHKDFRWISWVKCNSTIKNHPSARPECTGISEQSEWWMLTYQDIVDFFWHFLLLLLTTVCSIWKFYAMSSTKYPKSQQHYFDNLTFIIQNVQNVSLCISTPKKRLERGWNQQRRNGIPRISTGYQLEGFTKFRLGYLQHIRRMPDIRPPLDVWELLITSFLSFFLPF